MLFVIDCQFLRPSFWYILNLPDTDTMPIKQQTPFDWTSRFNSQLYTLLVCHCGQKLLMQKTLKLLLFDDTLKEEIEEKEEKKKMWRDINCITININIITNLNAIWSALKLNGDRRFLLLRFRPHTFLSLIINPNHIHNIYYVHIANIIYPFFRVDISVCHASMSICLIRHSMTMIEYLCAMNRLSSRASSWCIAA